MNLMNLVANFVDIDKMSTCSVALNGVALRIEMR